MKTILGAISAVLHYLRRWVMHLFEGRSLKAKRERYRFAQVPSLPGLNVQNGTPDIPFDETPSLEWLIGVAEVVVRTKLGTPFAEEPGDGADLEADDAQLAAMKSMASLETIGDAAAAINVLNRTVGDLEKHHTEAHNAMTWPERLEDYNDMYSDHKVPLPEVARHFDPESGNEGAFDDALFANLRTAGWNPMVIRGASSVPDAFADLTDEIYQRAVGSGFGDDTPSAAAADGRLFACDYSVLAPLIATAPNQAGDVPAQKYIYTPQVLLALPPNATAAEPASLVAVAIRLTPDGALFHPNDPADTDARAWTQAKYAVNSADGNYHELISHLAWTHLVIEPFSVCTQRNLREGHELYRLLVPHFEGTIFINNAAAGKLIGDNGVIDQLMAPVIQDGQRLAVAARAIDATGLFHFNDNFVPKALADRDVMSDRLVFPYRDDALRVWDAIRGWVHDYVDVYYPKDRHVRGDVELQNWAAEVVASSGGQIQGFGDRADGVPDRDKLINTREYLIDALTMIIFTASAQHAAVNFAQGVLMAYVPVAPLALFGSLDTEPPSAVSTFSPDGSTPGLLPPDSVAKLQIDVATLLGGVYYTQLGQYADGHFGNPLVKRALERFQNNLVGIEQQIHSANENRPLDYPYFLPSKIPQSINI